MYNIFNSNYFEQPVQGLIRVTGYKGADAYRLPANSCMPLFDANEDIMYVKTTDGAGFPTIKMYAFTPIEQTEVKTDFVTRKEFEELKEMISNGKQFVSEQFSEYTSENAITEQSNDKCDK